MTETGVFLLLHRICMPNIAPCRLTPRLRARKLPPCTPLPSRDSPLFTPDSGQAWVRLALALLIGSIGSVGMWSVVVVLPVVQAEFGATPGPVSLAFPLTILGFGPGGVSPPRAPPPSPPPPPLSTPSHP